ncbi:Set1 complex component swd1 [Lineolata rhizophorae]|uniref:Set1 complex component swd1 n=1 Tax=Lineolata rhizophorae TaxID=578093 RepID=A0A6A6P287_9PEZI|nr:Set1 complex component swd1 [Lineolata rhizophorae]
MNLSLLDPFVLAQDLPEALVGRLRSGHSTSIQFSHRGDYLASGRLDGVVIIFDIETNGVARKLRGHTHQVQSLSWSANDRCLLSAAHDWKCILWDLKDGSRLRTVKFEAAVFIAELHPKNHFIFAAALFEEQPMLVDMTGDVPIKRTLPTVPRRTEAERETISEKQAAQDAKQTTTVIAFAPSGDHIYTGTNRGWVNIIATATRQTLYSTRVTNNILVLIRVAPSGRSAVINSTDRIIRTLHLPDLSGDSGNVDFDNPRLVEVEHKFQDLVNRLSWNHAAFSSGSSGEYVAASTFMNHDIYVWERAHGSLVKILEGPREELSHLEWHPCRPFVAAVGVDSGRVYLWSILTPQRWSALAPDFVEVDENVEYVEREDEFDIQPLEELHKRRLDLEDEHVDVLTVVEPAADHANGKAAGAGDASSARAAAAQFQMPILLDIEQSDSEDEVIAVGAGQFRRKSPGQGREWMAEVGDVVAGSGAGMGANGSGTGTPLAGASGDEAGGGGSVGGGRRNGGKRRRE